jgi:hypothetical protein
VITSEALAVGLIMFLNLIAPLNVGGRWVLVSMDVGWVVTRFEQKEK